jgi:hypothetical protein
MNDLRTIATQIAAGIAASGKLQYNKDYANLAHEAIEAAKEIIKQTSNLRGEGDTGGPK